MIFTPRWKIILSLVIFFALFSIACGMDYEDALASEAEYCDRLSSGVHEDYDNLRKVCSERYWGK